MEVWRCNSMAWSRSECCHWMFWWVSTATLTNLISVKICFSLILFPSTDPLKETEILTKKNPTDYLSLCTGVLLTTKTALTSGSCIEQAWKGGFQLLDLIIPELKSHVIPYKFKSSHWLKLQHSDWRANLVKDFFYKWIFHQWEHLNL